MTMQNCTISGYFSVLVLGSVSLALEYEALGSVSLALEYEALALALLALLISLPAVANHL